MIRKIKRLARTVLPSAVTRFVSKRLIESRAKELSQLSAPEAFDTIYRKKFWQQGTSLSGPGSEGYFAEEYVRIVSDYIKANKVESICDGGCGDFSVGSQLAGQVASYVAGDISRYIIEENRRKFSSLEQVEFRVLNLIEDKIPACDLLLIRQVLQHLSNEQIEAVLKNVEGSSVKHVLITEHCRANLSEGDYNADLGSHSVATRVEMDSGIDLRYSPFSRSGRLLGEITPDGNEVAHSKEVLRIYDMFPS